MASRASEILRATEFAARIGTQFKPVKRTGFDIMSAARALKIPFLFRPLSGLWGATITNDNGETGILVTSKLDLHVQRFTLAHELGHVLLGHEVSFDETVGYAGRLGDAQRPSHEIAADTFASELLASKSLMLKSARVHKWTQQMFTDPRTVYQLSLRLGLSFLATSWALVGHRVLDKQLAQAMRDQPLQKIKRDLAADLPFEDSWANVWTLSAADAGTELEAGPNDMFSVHLQEDGSTGFLWDLTEVPEGTEILDDRREQGVDSYGGQYSRMVYFRFTAPGRYKLQFAHRRAWNRDTLSSIEFSIDGHGKERDGYARQVKEAMIGASAR
jgi:Zn-dependent peptidase ImmA (M78 family)/predicted secreted protein